MRKKNTNESSGPSYIESSLGIITTSGHWFHTKREHIETIAPEIFEHYTLDDLVKAAETWIKSSDSLALLLYFVLVLVISPPLSAILVLLFYLFWYSQKSALATPYLTRLISWINADITLLVIAGIFLSWMGMTGQYLALVIGVVFFFLFKLGLLRWAIDWLFKQFKTGITLNDRLLKMIVLKYAIFEGIQVPEIEDMDQKIQDLMTKHRSK